MYINHCHQAPAATLHTRSNVLPRGGLGIDGMMMTDGGGWAEA